MTFDSEDLAQSVQSPDGLVRLAAVLSTLSLQEIECFAGEIATELHALIYNDETAEAERVQLLVSAIAKFASDPGLKGTGE